MKLITCPKCERTLAEAQVKAKPTKDKKALKLRCLLCHHAWKLLIPEELAPRVETPAPEPIPQASS